jgi:hypothetical protein
MGHLQDQCRLDVAALSVEHDGFGSEFTDDDMALDVGRSLLLDATSSLS